MSDKEETYKITETEALQSQLLRSEIENATLRLQLAKERSALFQKEISEKYSEGGKYQLTGDIRLDTLEGVRKRVTEE